VENQLALELGVPPGSVLLDYPAKPAMLDVDLPLRLRGGQVELLLAANHASRLGIQSIGEELHTSARRLRVFAGASVRVAGTSAAALAERSAADLEAELGAGRPLLTEAR